ncbi:MAG: VWA domain-containing protein [Planctomycetota bacterium]|nr:VWA domain-containing protein [Planctomycetota bacterium]
MLALFGLKWARLEAWPVLILVGILIVACVVAGRASIVKLRAVIHPAQWQARMRGNRSGVARRQWWTGGLALVLLAVSLLGPQKGSVLMPVPRRGIDIVVCLDTSRSMLAQDVGQDRLAEAKKEIRGLMDVVQGDRLALIAFSGDVRRVAPLTRDTTTLGWFLETLSPDDNRRGGTDLGGCLRSALDMFDGRNGAHEAIVLVTDGEDLSGEGLVAAQEAAESGIRIYVLGMGTEGGAKVPGEGGGWTQDENGLDVISKLHTETLDQISEVTGGMYIQAHGTVLPLEQLYKRGFSRLQGRQYEQGFERVESDRFQWPLLMALILLAMEACVGGRLRRREDSQSMAETTGSNNKDVA